MFFKIIELFCSNQLGNVLILNGIIQLSEWDEFAYHEMAVHLPLFAHPKPKNVICLITNNFSFIVSNYFSIVYKILLICTIRV